MSKITCFNNVVAWAPEGYFREDTVNLPNTDIGIVTGYIQSAATQAYTREFIEAAQPHTLYGAAAQLPYYKLAMAMWVRDLPDDFELPKGLNIQPEDAYQLLNCGIPAIRSMAFKKLKETYPVQRVNNYPRLPVPTEIFSCDKLGNLNEQRFARPLRVLHHNDGFARLLNTATHGLLAGVIGEDAIAAGGAVNRLTVHGTLDGGDVDIFIIAKNKEQVFKDVLQQIEDNATQQDRKMYCTPKGSVMSLNFSNTSLTIQLIASDKSTGEDVIAGFDFSHCMIYWDGANRHANIYWFDSYHTNIVRYNPLHRTATSQKRIMKLFWQGYSIEDTYMVRKKYNIINLLSAIDTQSIDSIIDEMAVSFTLGDNDRENRRLLQLINGGGTKYLVDDALKIMELNSDFTLYSCAAWRPDKLAALIAGQFIVARENCPTVCASNGRPLVFIFDNCKILSVNEADRALIVDCPYAFDFCNYIERVASVIYLGVPVINTAKRGQEVIIQYRDGSYPTRWVANNGGIEQVVPIPPAPFEARAIKLIVKFYESQYTLVAQSVCF